ncbi:MAG: Hemagglutinin family protein [Microgenomates group bacterium GW2011_GWA1_48_10]|nr:MAG: Hemagglutinin family protein [Microgenomates group bacterium GW2011_GWA1_48_10]
MSKKFLSIALSVMTIGAFMGPVAYGQSTASLQDQINSLLATIATLQAQLAGQTGGTGATACTFTKDLTLGATGTDVQCLQQYLNGTGYTVATSGAGSPGNETTYFGSRTQAAVSKWQAANGVTPTAGYFGARSRAKYAAIGGTIIGGGGTVVLPPGTGLAASLAYDNPVGATVLGGSTMVPMMKFVLSGSGTVNTITLMRTGPGVAADFASSGIYLLDETGARLTTGRTVNSTSQEVNFTGLNLTVSGTKTLTVAASISTSQVAGNRNAFQLSSADKISGSVAVSGTFPVRGNEFTMGGSDIGTATIASSTLPANPKVGEVGAKLASFKITNNASADDLLVTKVTLRYAGAVSRANLSNFTVKYAGNTVGTGLAINSKDLAVLVFNPPFLIERGQNRIFEMFGDVSPSVRSGSAETIKFYIEDSNDVVVASKLYSYGATVTNNFDSSNYQQTTVDGGQITVTFNGPTNSDLASSGSDVTLFDFTVAAANNVEIKNLRFSVTTTGMDNEATTNEKFSDFKVVDAATGAVVAGPYASNIATTTTGIVLNDTWTISAGQSRRLRVTADVGSASAIDADTIYVTLVAWNSTDIKNVDSNTDVATADIVPNGITGNTHTAKAPSLTISLAGTPSSRTLSAGTANVDLVGIKFQAVADDIQIKTIKITATAGSNTAAGTISALGSLRLMTDVNGVQTQIGQSKGLTAGTTLLTAEFTNLNYTITKSNAKTITVNAPQIATNASTTTYVVGIEDLTTDVTAVDSQGNSLTISTPASINPSTGTAVQLTLATPSLTITRVGAGNPDTDSNQVIANGNRVLTRLEFRATNGDVNVKKIQFGISADGTAATAASVGDDVKSVSLKMCTSQSCSSKSAVTGLDALPIDANGVAAGTVKAESATGFFTIPRGESRYFTLEAALDQVQIGSADYADSGTDIYASVALSNFEAVAGNTTLTSFATSTGGTNLGVTGLQKELLKGQPVVSVSAPQGLLTAGLSEVLRMTVDAEGGSIALKAFGINMATSLATFSTAFSSSNVNVELTTSPGTNLVGSVSGAVINAGANGDLYIIFTNPQIIDPASPRTFVIKVTPDAVGTSANGAKIVTRLDRNETSISNSATAGAFLGDAAVYNYVNNTKVWVWSDLSDDSTGSETATEWSNAYLLNPFPTDTKVATP